MAEMLYFTLRRLKKLCRALVTSNKDKLKCAAAAFALGITPIGGLYPFGWAFFISCDKHKGLISAVLFICAVINGNVLSSTIFIAGIYAFKKLLRPTKKRPLIKTAAALCGAVFLCLSKQGGGIYNLASGVICAVALPLFTMLYGLYYTQKQGTTAHLAAVTAFLFSGVLFLNSVLPYAAPSRAAALFITLLAAFEGGMLYGGFLGFVCGLACDSATAAMLGVCGLTSGLLFSVSEYLALPIGCLAGLCTGMYFLGTDSVPTLILCFAVGILLCIGFKNKLRLFTRAGGAAPQKARDTAAHPLSEAFFAISQSARLAAGSESGAARAADDYASFSFLLNDAKEKKEAEEQTDEELSSAVSTMFSGAGVRAENVRVVGSRKKRLEAENVVIDALTLSSDSLSELVSKLTGTKMRQPEFYLKNGKAALYMESAPLYRIECSRTGVCKRGERISGDTVSFFKGKDGMFFALISDGMGSGSEAALSSRMASVFLEKLLAAGASRQNAIALLNSYLASRESEVFATVDLFEADLYTGRGVLVKAGAAPSFVIRGGKCRRLQSATVPAGIMREVRAEQLSFPLKHGDMLVMFSDGLAGDDNGAETEKTLLSLSGEKSTANIANALIEDAVQRTGKQDDMSVCVIKILAA